MKKIIRLSDGGQNYIKFWINNNLITKVEPSLLAGWKDTKVLKTDLVAGDRLPIQLHNGYSLVLNYPIVDIDIVS
jgi:hypothetical protein